jgi:hypothetical protein
MYSSIIQRVLKGKRCHDSQGVLPLNQGIMRSNKCVSKKRTQEWLKKKKLQSPQLTKACMLILNEGFNPYYSKYLQLIFPSYNLDKTIDHFSD